MTQPGTRRELVAPAGLFVGFGVIAASWVSRIPAVQSDLALDATRLGLALLGLPVGAVVASVLVPRLVRGDGRSVVVAAMPAAALSLAIPGLATGLLSLIGALVVFGVATGALDVSLNTYASHLERAVGRSIFGRLHGMWSLGALLGAGVGTAAAAGHVSPRTHFVGVGIVLAVATAVLLPRLRPAAASGESHPHRGWSRDATVVAFATVALAGLVVEVAAADWGGVFVHTVVGGGGTASAAAFAVFAALHLVVRLVGDRFVNRDARTGLLAVALGVSAAGTVLLASSTTTAFAYVSLAVIGAGVSLVFPVALAGAGQIAGVSSAAGVATAAGTSYVGWAATPPLIGLLAGAAGLRVALLLPAVVALVALAVLGRASRRRAGAMHTGCG